MASILTSVTYIASPLSCLIVKRLGSRKSAFVSGVLLSLSCITSSFVKRIEVLYVTFGLLYGFGNSLMMNMLFIVLFQYFEKKSAIACGMCTNLYFVLASLVHNMSGVVRDWVSKVHTPYLCLKSSVLPLGEKGHAAIP